MKSPETLRPKSNALLYKCRSTAFRFDNFCKNRRDKYGLSHTKRPWLHDSHPTPFRVSINVRKTDRGHCLKRQSPDQLGMEPYTVNSDNSPDAIAGIAHTPPTRQDDDTQNTAHRRFPCIRYGILRHNTVTSHKKHTTVPHTLHTP